MKGLNLIFFVGAMTTSTAAFADERCTKGAKFIETLKKVSIADSNLTAAAKYFDQNTRDNLFYMADHEVADTGIHVQLRYDTRGLKSQNLQLNITPENPPYNLTANTHGVMANYKWNFN